MSPWPTRAYDPERDILFVTNEAFDNFTGSECGYGGPDWVSKIHHLAIGLSMAGSGLSLPIAMARLSSLETLSIVYPGPSGDFNFSDAVKPPAEKGTPLRCLTEEELGRLTVEANYMYGTWAGDFPVRWAKSGPEHLEMVEAALDDSCRPENAGDFWQTPLWDHEAKRLGIRYEARCFQPLPTREKFHL
ncbi:hypothetical protein C8A01DRAFT_16983 [Parachaetomium inaequale]|uniref:Uncharacterized protein n=1 Tax=Parachaetomium inaequale TaxID=2588326 RepID=A0AAN6SR37_9PEZI|nr:hypothetical protein C8A01DRAFT_16983 [Parachaetomium inaequale]